MNVSMSKSVFAVLVAVSVLLGGQWAWAGNLPTWGGATTTNQPQPIQQPRQTIVSQPAANTAQTVQAPQPGTWTAPVGTQTVPTWSTPTQQQPTYQTQPAVTPRTGTTNRTLNLQPKAVTSTLTTRSSGFTPELPTVAPATTCSGYRQTPDVDRLSAPPQSPSYPPRSAAGADLHCTDLTGAYLSRADFKGANLRGAKLSGVDLRGADFTGAFLEDADLTGANLGGAKFTNARLNRTKLINTVIGSADGADFRGAIIDNLFLGGTLKNAHFDGLDLKKLKKSSNGLYGDFSGSTFTNTVFSGISIGMQANFSRCYLARNSFQGASIFGAKFTGANLSLTDFSAALLYQVDFSNATLTGATFFGIQTGNRTDSAGRIIKSGNALIAPSLNFTGANAVDANFTQANLYNQTFGEINMARAKFNGAKLQKSSFTRTDLRGASFLGSDLTESWLNGVNAENSKFDSAQLRVINIKGSNFKQASISRADMSHSLIQNSSFYQANLQQSKFNGVMFDSPDMRMANFMGSILSGSIFTPTTQFSGANFTGATMLEIQGCSVNLYNSGDPFSLSCYDPNISSLLLLGTLDLRSVNFSNANLTDARIKNDSDLRNSNLSGAKLSRNFLSGLKLSGAIMPDGTVHP